MARSCTCSRRSSPGCPVSGSPVIDPRVATVATAAAQATTFMATAPVMPEGVPAIVRAALAIVTIPLLAQPLLIRDHAPSVLAGACSGAAYGLGASMVAAAVKGAGSVVDTMLGSPPFVSVAKSGGPVERLYHLGYGAVLFGSGGFSLMLATLASASGLTAHHGLSMSAIVMLVIVSMRECLTLAGPCLFAQALATIATGLVSRASPGVGGVLFGAQLSSACVLFALVMGAAMLHDQLVDVVRTMLEAAQQVFR